jgi:hypothetical protein
MYLLLAGGYMPGIDVGLLKVGENELAGGGVIAVGAKQHVGELELRCHREKFLRLVILGTVNNDDGVLSPRWSLLIQPMSKRPKKKLHHLTVGVGLGQGDIHIAEGVQAKDHGDPWSDLYLWNRVRGAWLLPFHPPKVTHADPRLVDV